MRQFRVYDTLSRETRLFVPRVPPKVDLFVCGLTPYDEAHIGHARTAVMFDVVARVLRRWGYRVFYVQNVTNLDDRLINRAGELGIDPLALAERHFLSWQLAMERLGVRSVNYYPRATDYIDEIVAQVGQLVDRGYAYPARGSVYYRVSRFPNYGKLSGQRIEALRPGAHAPAEPEKESPEDFVLWKAARPGEPSWSSPWGPGRPGWHIEDTAITVRLFGPQYDLHGGGVDLKFPHHEAEIAQAEGATGRAPLVNVWMHGGMLTFRGEKMSKSLGNVVSLSETLNVFAPEVLRFYYLNSQYRSPLEFVDGKSLEEAREAHERLFGPRRRLQEQLDRVGLDGPGRELAASLAEEASAVVGRMDDAMADDFNTRETIAILFQYVRSLAEPLAHLDALSGNALVQLDGPFQWAEEVLGLDTGIPRESLQGRWDPLVQAAIAARARARERGDFSEADRIRQELGRAGIQLEDDANGTRWRWEH